MADPATNEGGTPAPNEGGTPNPNDGGGGSPDSWTSHISDEGLRSWAETKGWQDVTSAVKSARHLESMVGAPAEEVVRIPSQMDDETFSSVMSRLGRPESPDGYELTPAGQDADEDFMGWFKNTAHSANLTKAQAAQMQSAYDEYVMQRQDQELQSHQANVLAEDKALQKEWGNGYDKNIRKAQMAAQTLGLDEDALTALEYAKGYGATLNWLTSMADALGEDNFVSGEGGGGQNFGTNLTPDEARAAISRLHGDPAKMKALQDNMHPEHKAVMEERKRLFAVAYPE